MKHGKQLALMSALALAGGSFGIGYYLAKPRQRALSTEPSQQGIDGGVTFVTYEGNWGRLEVNRMLIAPPSDYVHAEQLKVGYNNWFFPNTTVEQARSFFQEAGLSTEQIESLFKTGSEVKEINGVMFQPSAAERSRLTPVTRSKIYGLLGEQLLNRDQMQAFRFSGGGVSAWFEGTSVAPEIIQEVERLSYSNGPYLFFADLPLVLPHLKNDEERHELVRALNRQTSAHLALRIDHSSNVDELVKYWGRGKRSNDIRPIIESVASQDTLETLDVVHLLPPFARLRLYAYPDPDEIKAGANYNCFWTAFNFFNEVPDNRFNNLEETKRELQVNYHKITNEEAGFGDLVMFESNGEFFHAANYIAADFVFTKNGNRVTWPWMFKRLERLKFIYPKSQPVQIHFFRKNEFGP